MAASADRIESARARLNVAIDDFAAVMGSVEGSGLGEGLIHTREAKDRLEAVFAEGLRRFDKCGEYAADGALDLVAWLRSKCKLSGGAAAERVGIARQLEQLPATKRLLPLATSATSMWPLWPGQPSMLAPPPCARQRPAC